MYGAKQIGLTAERGFDEARGIAQYRQPRTDQLIALNARRRGRAVDRSERTSPVVDDRNGERDQPVVEFVLDGRVTAFAHVAKDTLQLGFGRDGVLGESRERAIGEIGRAHIVGLEGEDRAPQRRRIGR